MVVYGLAGIPGLIVGGLLGDRMMKHRSNGRLLLASIALAISAPLMFLGLGRPIGDIPGFVLFCGCGISLMYIYYSTVYSAIQDVIEPSLRGTAMALYFFAMYVLGASLGPVGMGLLSNYFTRRAALAAGLARKLERAAFQSKLATSLRSRRQRQRSMREPRRWLMRCRTEISTAWRFSLRCGCGTNRSFFKLDG